MCHSRHQEVLPVKFIEIHTSSVLHFREMLAELFEPSRTLFCTFKLLPSSKATQPMISPLPYLPPDCISTILSYHIFHLERLHPYIYGPNKSRSDDSPVLLDKYQRGKYVEMTDADWYFVVDYGTCCEFYGMLNSFDLLAELLISCRDLKTKPVLRYAKLHLADYSTLLEAQALPHLRGIRALDLSHLYVSPRGVTSLKPLFSNLRGIQELHLGSPSCASLTKQDFENLRGVRKLSLKAYDFKKLPDDVYENLRGISSLCLKQCHFPPKCALLPNLRGIKHFELDGCHGLKLSAEDFRDLRGIHKLVLIRAPFTLTEQHLDHLKGSIQELTVHCEKGYMVEVSPLTDTSIHNLRGIQKFAFHYAGGCTISDSAFVALRGVKEVRMKLFRHVTSAALEHLRGIQCLKIRKCPNMEFNPQALSNLKGIKNLSWDYMADTHWQVLCDKRLHEPCLKHLRGVQYLRLDSVITVSHKSFRHLSDVRELILKGKENCRESKPMKSAAFGYLKNVEKVHLTNMNLVDICSFPQLLDSRMPKLQQFTVEDCYIVMNADTKASQHDWQMRRRKKASFSFERNDDGRMVAADFTSERSKYVYGNVYTGW